MRFIIRKMLALGLFSWVTFMVTKINKNMNNFQDSLSLTVSSVFICSLALHNAIQLCY